MSFKNAGSSVTRHYTNISVRKRSFEKTQLWVFSKWRNVSHVVRKFFQWTQLWVFSKCRNVCHTSHKHFDQKICSYEKPQDWVFSKNAETCATDRHVTQTFRSEEIFFSWKTPALGVIKMFFPNAETYFTFHKHLGQEKSFFFLKKPNSGFFQNVLK